MNTAATLLPNWLARCAENTPHHLAIKSGELQWSFAELDQQANHLAYQFVTAGVQTGQRVAILSANGLPLVVCIHALTRLGAILVPLNIRLTQEELCWQIKDVQATLLVSDTLHAPLATSMLQTLSTSAPSISPSSTPIPHLTMLIEPEHYHIHLNGLHETPAHLLKLIDLNATQAIMYTSGTTGTPKGVLITYGMQWWNAIGSALNLGHQTEDCWLVCLPLFHIGGLSILMRSVINGISVVLQEKFDPATVNKAIFEDKITIISVVAIMLQRLLSNLDATVEKRHYPSTLRCVLLGGGPAPRSLLENCAERRIPVVQTYGLTEACSQAVTLSPTDALRKLGSAGRPLLPVQLRIMNEDKPAATNQPGIICLKGPGITPGYDHRPEATSQAIQDGWLSTGDLGYLDEDGYLYVLDRRSDLIISGGENIYPAEIESILLSHPAVEEAGVCGQSDTQWGQVPIAFVHLHEASTTTPDELLTYLARYLARFKLPRTIYLVKHLPRNSSGKLLRRDLPSMLSQEKSPS